MPYNESYFIAINLPEPLNSEISELKKGISVEYRTRSVLKSPPHITIIPPFFWSNENGLIQLMKGFKQDPFQLRLKNYGAFVPSVVYIDVVQDNALMDLHKNFNLYFYQNYPSLKKKHPYPFHPHITIGNRDWKKEDFTKCWNVMKDKTFEAEFIVQKLSLLKLTNSLWQTIL